MHLIQNMLFLKGDSTSNYFSFFVFYFNTLNKIFSTRPRLLNSQEFSNLPPPVSFKPPRPPIYLLSFEEFFNPSIYSNPPSIKHSREIN